MSPSLSALAPLWQKNQISGKATSSLKLLCGLITIFMVFNPSSLNAQIKVYPVSLTTQLTPPYSVNLADYVSPGCEQLKLIVVQRDLTQAPYMLYLKMEITLNGRVIIRTSPQYIPPPLTLDPGIPTVISGSDLYPFFDPVNMEFSVEEIRDTYLRTRILPEGAYIISFTAYDFTRRDVALSNGGSMFCYLAKTDPPLLNFPLNNTGVPSSPSQFINFQWLSRNTASPNSAQSTRYRLDLFEIRLDGRNPAEIVQSMRPFFTTETDRTTYLYSINDPVLEAGLRYAWRIRAFDTNGRDYIRNDGYSEVFSFVYGVAENIELPSEKVENFTATALSPRNAKLKWDASSDFDSYKVFYRKQGGDTRWYEDETIQNTFELKGLSPGNIYDCRVQGKKNSIWGGFSEIDTVLMPVPAVIVCGSQYQTAAISNREPINTLMKMQEIEAGGFVVTIIDAQIVNGVPGMFTGRGFVQVPLFSHKKVRCEFSNIFVNTDYQMAEGIIHLMVDKSEGGDNAIWDVDEVFEGGANNGMVKDGTDGVAVTLPTITIPGEASITIDTVKQELVIVTTAGITERVSISEQLKDDPKTITVKDSGGNLYSVDTQSGKATSIGKAPAEGSRQQVSLPSTINSGRAIVSFEPMPGKTKYAFDKRNKDYAKSSLFTEKYKTMPMSDGSPYDIPFKLIPAGETDIVLAKVDIMDKTLDPDSIIFQSGTGTQYSRQASGTKGQYQLTLPSGKDNDGIDVFALYPRQNNQPYLLGKITIMSYSTVRPKVVLVPVNGNNLDAGKVKKELDKVYLPMAVDWQVSVDDSNFSASADSLDVTGSGLFSQYTPGMKRLNTEFIIHKGAKYDPSTLYLFVLQYSDRQGATGDMPRSKQFGYLFTKTALDGGEDAIYRTIAHELAHGIFNLKHTFDTQYQIPQASTNNLMDYTSGTDLVKHQWDAIHDPGLVLGMFERDEEGMMINIPTILSQIREANIQDYRTLKITQDQCPQVCYQDLKLGTSIISYLQINCSKEFENKVINENNLIKLIDWSLTPGSKIMIKPSEKSKVFSETTKGDAVYIKFHEVKEKPVPLIEEMTENFLFEFVVLKKDLEKLEEYLFPNFEISMKGIPYLSQLDSIATANATGCSSGCCQAASSWMINQKNNTIVNHNSRVYFEDVVNAEDLTQGVTQTLNDIDFNETIEYIKKSIRSDKSVLFGTWDSRKKEKYSNKNPKAFNSKPPGSKNSPTTHFMVIVGYGYDKSKGKFYLLFYDPGRSDSTDGANPSNKLYIDTTLKEITTTSYRGLTYKVTEIRRNY